LKNSGPSDALPSNRFIRRSPAKLIWIGAVAVAVALYLFFELPAIIGAPSIAITFPPQSPYAVSSNTATLSGRVRSVNSLTLKGDAVTIAPDGTWTKLVFLQSGPNTFQLKAKKFLGGEADATVQIFYQAPAGVSSSVQSSTASTSGF